MIKKAGSVTVGTMGVNSNLFPEKYMKLTGKVLIFLAIIIIV